MSELPAAVPTVQIDNECVRVTEWRMAVGAHTGWHRHEFDYVVVPLLDGVLRAVDGQGEQRTELKSGVSYHREAGVEHDVVNAGGREFAFLEVEIKAHRIGS
jgi:beta-alanine degradation protein BauB